MMVTVIELTGGHRYYIMARVFIPAAEEACRPQTPEMIEVHIDHRGVRYTFVVPSSEMWRVAVELFEAIPEKVGRSWRYSILCGTSLGGPDFHPEDENVAAVMCLNAEETVTLYEPDDSEDTFVLSLRHQNKNYTETHFNVHDKTTIMQVVEAFTAQPLSQGRSWVFRTRQGGLPRCHWPVIPNLDLAFLQRTCGDVFMKERSSNRLFIMETNNIV